MRFYFLVALLALIAGLCSASDFSDCWAKNKNIISAINNFCGWTYDLVSLMALSRKSSPLMLQVDRPKLQSQSRRLRQRQQCQSLGQRQLQPAAMGPEAVLPEPDVEDVRQQCARWQEWVW